VLGAALFGAAVPASAQSLTEALAEAYRTNPQLLAQRALLRATDEMVPQALANWRPTVAFTGQTGYAVSACGGASLSRRRARPCREIVCFIPGMHGSDQWKEGNEFGDAIIPKSNVNTVAHKPTCRKVSIEATANNRFWQIVHLKPPRTGAPAARRPARRHGRANDAPG
jgi:hypothetical protein